MPLILAATGELVAEKSGVLNLGVEGMMLMGAVAAFGAASLSGNPYMGIMAGALGGMATAAVFGLFALGLATNQVATGLALTIFGTGLSGLIGAPLVGSAIDGLSAITIPLLSEIPLIGVAFTLDFMAYLSIAIVAAVAYFLTKTRMGLVLRATGANHDSAHALGYNVLAVRWMAVLFGGFMAGLAGAYLPLVLTPHWAEGMTAGRGWIALALVVLLHGSLGALLLVRFYLVVSPLCSLQVKRAVGQSSHNFYRCCLILRRSLCWSAFHAGGVLHKAPAHLGRIFYPTR